MIQLIHDSFFLLFVIIIDVWIQSDTYNTRDNIYERSYFQNLSIFIDSYDGIEFRRRFEFEL